jgi:hypothetical protein
VDTHEDIVALCADDAEINEFVEILQVKDK